MREEKSFSTGSADNMEGHREERRSKKKEPGTGKTCISKLKTENTPVAKQ
jgi:hypothetical protein